MVIMVKNDLLGIEISSSVMVTSPSIITCGVSDVIFSVHLYEPLSAVVSLEKVSVIPSVEILS